MAISTSTQQTRPGQLRLLVILGALSAFGPLSIDMYLPGLPSLAQDLGGANWQVQLTLTACILGLAGGQVVSGPLSDMTGRRRPLLIGLALFALTSLVCAFAPSVLILIALRFVQGLAGATGVVIARAMVRDLYSGAEAARFFALTLVVSGLAPILAPIIGGQLLNFTSWRGVFVLLTVIGTLLLLAATLGLSESLPPDRRQTEGLAKTLRIFGSLLTDRAFMGYALAGGLAFAAMFAYISGSPFVLENLYGLSPQLFSLVFASNALGLIVTSQVGSRLVGRVSPRRLLRIGLSLSLTGGLLLLAAVTGGLGLAGILPGFFLVVASLGLIAPNATALALAEHSQVAGSASGLIGVLQYLFGGIVTPLVGLGGTSTALPLAVIILILSLSAFSIFQLLNRAT